MNLIPETVQRAQSRRRCVQGWAVAVGVASGLLAVPLVLDGLQRAEATRLRAEQHKVQTLLGSARADLRTLAQRANKALSQLERAKALRAKRAWSAIFVIVDASMPTGCWLTAVATDPAMPSPRQPRSRGRPYSRASGGSGRSSAAGGVSTTVRLEAPRKLRIAGYATDAAEPYQFVTNLKSSGIFTDVALERSRREERPGGSYFRFALVCEW